MVRWDPVDSIDSPSNSGNNDAEGPEFIQCVDGREPQIHEVWTFGEDGVTREVHPTAQLDVVSGLVGEFATNYLTVICCRFPMFGINSINVSVEWLGVPDFHRIDGPALTDNILDPCPSWVDGGSDTNLKW